MILSAMALGSPPVLGPGTGADAGADAFGVGGAEKCQIGVRSISDWYYMVSVALGEEHEKVRQGTEE